MAMLGKQPRERPTSMKQALEALEMALNDTLTFAYDESPDRLASTEEILSSAPDDDAEPLASPPPRVVRPPAPEQAAVPERVTPPERPAVPERATPPERAAPLEMPHEWPIPIAPERATAPEPRVAPERSTAPPPRPPLITPVPQARPPGATLAAAEPELAPHAGAVASSAPAQSVPSPAAARSAPPLTTPSTPASAPAAPLRANRMHEPDLRAIWGDIDLRADRVPNLMKLEPDRRSRWPMWMFIGVAAAAVVFVLMHSPAGQRPWVPPSADKLRALAPPSVVQAVRGAVEAPLRAVQNASSAAHSAGATASTPQSLPAAPGASAPTSPSTLDQPRTTAAVPGPAQLPTVVAGKAPFRSPPARASRAAGQRGRSVPGVTSLLSDARAAESARDYSRAAQDYSQALSLDPRNAAARAGLVRANDAFGAGEYSQAVGSGFAALGAGRLEEARKDFQLARRIDPHGGEAAQGLRQVAAALDTRDAAAERYRARNDLESRLQALVDDPQQLDSASMRAEAASLIREAEATPSSGAVLRSLADRLAILLPAYDKPVHLSLVSDNLTEIKIPEIGSFGTFARREIDLKPGKYTVIGTRAGYQQVRLDVTVAPGQDVQTISVRCEVPI